jgi:hypothetical protein
MSDDKRGFTLVEGAGDGADLPKPDFEGFLISLGSSALIHLGIAPHPETGKTQPNLALARQTIDMIELLDEKTRGNLTPHEAELLRNLLTELRLRFVNASRGAQGA